MDDGITREEAKLCVGRGWHGLIDTLYDHLDRPVSHGIQITQVKEKFGGLRVYSNQTNDDFEWLLSGLETLSLETCEICGKPGIPRDGAWIKTLCDQCKADQYRASKIA